LYLRIARVLGLYRGIIWQASSKFEEDDIRRWFGKDVPVLVAPNLPPVVHSEDKLTARRQKIPDSLKVLFLSRISRKKNLEGAIKMLKGLKGDVQLNIYGPLED